MPAWLQRPNHLVNGTVSSLVGFQNMTTALLRDEGLAQTESKLDAELPSWSKLVLPGEVGLWQRRPPSPSSTSKMPQPTEGGYCRPGPLCMYTMKDASRERLCNIEQPSIFRRSASAEYLSPMTRARQQKRHSNPSASRSIK